MPIYSDREFDYVLKKHADQLVVVCASSTDCVPCRNFEPVFDVSTPTFISMLFIVLAMSLDQLHMLRIIASGALGLADSTLHCHAAVLRAVAAAAMHLFWSAQLTSWFLVQRFASVYKKVVFLHFYAESNQMTKYLDQVRLKVERHPHFAFFRDGK